MTQGVKTQVATTQTNKTEGDTTQGVKTQTTTTQVAKRREPQHTVQQKNITT